MKNILFTLFAFIFSISLNAQYWTSEHVTINEGLSEEYEKFESFWAVAKEKAIKDGIQSGWFIWKVNPSSNNNNPWADYIIINTYESMEQLEAQVDWLAIIEEAHKGKTKRSVIRKYLRESTENKYRARSRNYTMESLSSFTEEGLNPDDGITATYISMEELNDDYVEFEKEYFKNQHSGRKYFWDFSEIKNRSENAYKPITHTIFEINKVGLDAIDDSFTNKMMTKYGMASREMHGWLQLEFLMGR